MERPLDGLVNKAAATIARTETLSPGAFDSIINVVLHGQRLLSPGLANDGSRRTTRVRSSMVTSSGWQGRSFMVTSAAAKAGVISTMRSLAVECGIRTVMVVPPIFPTRGSAKLFPHSAGCESRRSQDYCAVFERTKHALTSTETHD
ncbi:hypothetical protein [Bradyrhizobium canariense]|uniref:hypothetical protein n=1 Tax=Bradyrhizobium canariense TaxID=255045 RepID=UPI0034E04441